MPFGIPIEESVREKEREKEGGGGNPRKENEAQTEKERIDTRASERARRRRWMNRSMGKEAPFTSG